MKAIKSNDMSRDGQREPMDAPGVSEWPADASEGQHAFTPSQLNQIGTLKVTNKSKHNVSNTIDDHNVLPQISTDF